MAVTYPLTVGWLGAHTRGPRGIVIHGRTEYWRTLYPSVTQEKIAAFEAEYRGSADEAHDLKEAYVQQL